MSTKQNQIALVTLIILTSLVGLLYTNQIAPVSTISAQAISTAISAKDTGYALFYDDRGTFYTYTIGNAAPAIIELPSTITSNFDNSLRSIEWSNQNRAFLISKFNDYSHTGFLYIISDNQTKIEPIIIGDPRVPPDVLTAQWGPDGKSMTLVLVHPDPNGGGNLYHYAALYTPDGKIHIIASPGVFDAAGQPTMTFASSERDDILGVPQWSPDGKTIAYSISRTLNADTLDSQTIIEERLVDTACIISSDRPCKIRVLKPKSISETWSNFSWLHDDQHLIFNCETFDNPTTGTETPQIYLANEDICEIASDGSDFRHFSLFNSNMAPVDTRIGYALSPDGKTLAYTWPPVSGISFYDIAVGQTIAKIATSSSLSGSLVRFMAWLPVSSIQAFAQLPTLTSPPPTVTPSMKLSLKAVCLPASRNSLNQDIWQWEVINPNPVPVTYLIDWYDIMSKKIETATVVVQAAKSNVVAQSEAMLLTQPGPNKVHLYVDGVLQDEQTVPPLPCPG